MSHVIDWTTAAVEWTVNGFELSVKLVPETTARHTAVIADELEEQLPVLLRRPDLNVSHIDPADDLAAELLVTSWELLTVDPHQLRLAADQIADHAANRVTGEAFADRAAGEQWLAALRREPPPPMPTW